MRSHLEQVLRQTDTAKVAAKSFLKLEAAPLTLGVMCTIGPLRFVGFLNDFREQHPGIEVSTVENVPGRLSELLLAGTLDLLTNAAVGLLVGLAAFGFSFGALILAAAVYVSSSAITVKGLIDFRRLADEETDLVLAILLFEDLAIAFVLGFAATGGGSTASTLGTVGKAIAFIGISLAASRWLSKPLDRLLDWLPREFFLLFTVGILVGMAALAQELGLSEAIGALMA